MKESGISSSETNALRLATEQVRRLLKECPESEEMRLSWLLQQYIEASTKVLQKADNGEEAKPTNMKPFNLEAALNGEPVMLRNGQKAFVRHHETEQPIGTCWQLWGIRDHKNGSTGLMSWSKDGSYDIDGCVSNLDIISMYPKTRIINGFEVPAPESKEPKNNSKSSLLT